MKCYLGGGAFNNFSWHIIFYNKHKGCYFCFSTVRKMTFCLNTVRLQLWHSIFTSVRLHLQRKGEVNEADN